MKETMYTYILQEQETLLSIIRNRQINLKEYLKKIANISSNKWVVLSTGSSYNAMLCAKYYVENIAKVSIDFKTNLPFIKYDQTLKDNEVVFAVSQSGRSTSTINALKKAKNNFCVSLTSNVKDGIVKYSNTNIEIGCGEEKVGYVTKGFSSTILTFMLVGLETARIWGRIDSDKYQEEIYNLEKMVGNINRVIDVTNRWYENYKDILINAKHFVGIAYGPMIGVINEMDTKFTETIRVPVNARELEEYMHGPYLQVNNDQVIFFIQGNNELEKRANMLKEYISGFCNYCISISYKKLDKDPRTLCLGVDYDELISSILMVIPIQILAYRIAEDKKSDYTSNKFEDFSRIMSSKLF